MENSVTPKKCILLGIGGTGAKVVEAALILMASGLGPSKVHVGLIDQDMANGNVARTQTLVNNLVNFRKAWSNKAAENVLDWSSNSAFRFGAVEILPLFEAAAASGQKDGTCIWCPERNEGTLRDIVGRGLSPEQSDLFDLLFMANDEEQRLDLGQGYRGRAHVGSAALAATLIDGGNLLIKRISDEVDSGSYDEIDIFLVGSAFGGTGAAGFPTVARSLMRLKSETDEGKGFKNRDKVFIGGQLMLPYFTFSGPEDESGPSVVTADELMPKTQLALEYYYNLLKHEKAFDRLYATGWNRLFDLKYHKPGSAEQTNPALLPELIAATAVLDFFGRNNAEEAKNEPASSDVPVLNSARQNHVIKWADMPFGMPSGKEVRLRLGQALRFAASWRYEGRALLSEDRKVILRKIENWAQRLSGKVNVADAEDALNALDAVLDNILKWAATIEATGDASWVRGPWTLDGLNDPAHQPVPTEPVRLASRMDNSRFRDAFNNMIRVDSGDPEPRSANTSFEIAVAAKPSRGDHKGIGRAIAVLYDSVAVG